MVQYQIVWFTGFCCMHPIKSIDTKRLFFYSKFMLQKMVVAIGRVILDLKDDNNIVMKFIPG